MTGAFLIAWLAFPVVLLLITAGVGLALRAISGGAIPGVLVLPAGLATTVVLCTFLTSFHPTARLAGPLSAVLGGAGLIWTWRRGERRRERPRPSIDPWAVVAAAGPFAVVAAPVALSGHPGFSGYGRIVDIAYQFDLAAHFAAAGRVLPKAPDSSYLVVLQKYLSTGYPGGGQATLGSLSRLTPVDLAWLYQTYLAFVAGMMGLSLYSLAGALIRPRPFRALAALVAAQPNILLAYTLVGGIKELDTACFLILSAALFNAMRAPPAPGRRYVALPLAVSASFSSLQLVVAPWFGVLLAGLFASSLYRAREWRRVVAGWLQMAVVFAIVTGPSLAASLKLLPIARGRGIVDLGNLAAPVPNWAASGVWLTGDHRFPLAAAGYPTATYVLIGIALALAVVGVASAARARALTLLSLGLAGAVSIAYVSQRYGPWIQLKAQCLTAPIALLFTFLGASAIAGTSRSARSAIRTSALWARLRTARMRPWRLGAGMAGGLAVSGAVVFGNALAYHDTALAPYARLHDLEKIGDRLHGQGPALATDFEEYAEYFLRDVRATVLVNAPHFRLAPGVNPSKEPGGKFVYDTNEFAPSFLQGFKLIIRRRNPLLTRPPADFRLIMTTPYYEVWQRLGPSSVIAHFPLLPAAGPRAAAFCAAVASTARAAGGSVQMAYAPSANLTGIDAFGEIHSRSIKQMGNALIAHGPGRAAGTVPVLRATRYSIWQGGSFGRPVTVFLDGRRLGTISYTESYPAEYVPLGTRWLSTGGHVLSFLRGGGSLHPGSGDGADYLTRTIGPTILRPLDQPPGALGYTSVNGFSALCRSAQPWDWVEVVRSSARQP